MSFAKLVADPTFCPDGGHIGFGLRHDYPLQKTRDRYARSLEYLEGSLKGSDAILMKICKELFLEVTLRIVYRDPDVGLVLCDEYMQQGVNIDEEQIESILSGMNGRWLEYTKGYDSDDDDDPLPPIDVEWATPMKPVDIKEMETVYMAHGNEPSINFVYSTLCLIVSVSDAKDRQSSL